MAAGEFLPPVVTRLSANIDDLLAKVEVAKSAIKSLDSRDSVDLQLQTDGFVAVVGEIAAMHQSLRDVDADLVVQTALLSDVRDKLTEIAALSHAAADGQRAMTDATNNGTRAWGLWGLAGRLSLHWLISGFAEYLAVAIPGTFALFAGLAALTPEFVNIYQHESALATAMGDLGSTTNKTGTAIGGLAAKFNQIAQAAAPGALSIYGSALNILGETMGHFGGLAQSVVNLLSRFGAELTVDLKGGTFGSLFKAAEPDLQEFGEVLGNIGHAILNVARAAPGLAEVLLKIAGAASQVIKWVSSMPAIFIGLGIGIEEAVRYGGLLKTLFNWFINTGFVQAIAKWVTGFGALVTAEGFADAATITLSGAFTALWGFMTGPLFIGIAAVAGVVGVLYLAFTHAESQSQKLVDSLNKLALQASNMNVVTQLGQNLQTLGRTMAQMPRTIDTVGAAYGRFGGGVAHSVNPAISTLNNGMSQQIKTLGTVLTGAQYLMKTYGISFPGALALAQSANVKLTSSIVGNGRAAQVARQEIANLVTGLDAMGVPAGVVGSDLQAMEYQTELAASQVSKLNQAWDTFESNAASAQNAFITYEEANVQLGSGLKSTTNAISGVYTVLSNGVKLVGASMTGTNAASLQLRQQFQQSVGDVTPLIDAFRLAGIHGNEFSNAVRSAIFPLVNLGKHAGYSRDQLIGLAQQADANIKTWPEFMKWIDGGSHSLKNLNNVTGLATGYLSDLQKMASQLNTSIQQDIISTVSAATLKVSGFNTAVGNAETAIKNTNYSAFHKAQHQVYEDVLESTGSIDQAKAAMQLMQNQWNSWNPSAKNLDVSFNEIFHESGPPPGLGVTTGPPRHATGGAVRSSSGGTESSGAAEVHAHVYIDGKEVYTAVQKQAVRRQKRTGSNGLTRTKR